MKFDQVENFLSSWGLHFDTPDEDSNDIPYPQVYGRMLIDAKVQDPSGDLSAFIQQVTETTDGRTYLTVESSTELGSAWYEYIAE
jgi:hypothetical protein